MDCDELIDGLLSAQGAAAGLAEGAPLAAAPARGTAATPDAPHVRMRERVQKRRERLAAREAKPSSMD